MDSAVMNHPFMSVLVTAVILILFGYFNKLDMADLTGFARTNAKEGMLPLADKLGYEYVAARAETQQAGLKKRFGRYIVEVNPEASQIEVEFSRPLGIHLSSLPDSDFDAERFVAVEFTQKSLNDLFKVRALHEKGAITEASLETVIVSLADKFLSRKVKYIYLENEYLRVGYEYRNYLPVSVIEDALPTIEQTAEGLLALK
ncbi:MAG: hypothetical protein MI867_18910 [Pseudomonadales bacterium]|nr:hypothetical protein [Pseudomonadales bacterium]